EGLRVERQGEDVRLPELHVGESGQVGPSPGFCNRVCGDINRRESGIRTPPGKGYRLSADAAPDLKHNTAGGVCRVGVQQVNQRSSLILQTLVLTRVVAVYISFAHDFTFLRRLTRS